MLSETCSLELQLPSDILSTVNPCNTQTHTHMRTHMHIPRCAYTCTHACTHSHTHTLCFMPSPGCPGRECMFLGEMKKTQAPHSPGVCTGAFSADHASVPFLVLPLTEREKQRPLRRHPPPPPLGCPRTRFQKSPRIQELRATTGFHSH